MKTLIKLPVMDSNNELIEEIQVESVVHISPIVFKHGIFYFYILFQGGVTVAIKHTEESVTKSRKNL